MRNWWIGVALTVCLAAQTAEAQSEDVKLRAKELYSAGVASYNKSEFESAAQAFMEAYELVQRPELLFSIGQAYRRQWVLEPSQRSAQLGVKFFRQYLEKAPDGARRTDAVRGIDLMLVAAGGDDDVAIQRKTQINVRTNAPDAVVSIDGGPWYEMPYSNPIDPGRHSVVVRAPGYLDGNREINAEKGRTEPVDVPLNPKPPLLIVNGADGADVTIDGKVVGEAPFDGGFEVPVGRHFVAVTANGYKPYAEELDFGNGEETTVDLYLPATNQRRAAYGVLVSGGVIIVGAAVVTGLAFVEQRTAQDIQAQQESGTITQEQLREHNEAIDRRDQLRASAAAGFGAGALVAAVGLGLYFFDDPAVKAPSRRSDDGEEEQPTKPESEGTPELELIGAAPIVVPGPDGISMAGLSVGGRF